MFGCLEIFQLEYAFVLKSILVRSVKLMSIIHRASRSCSLGECMIFLAAYTLDLVGFILDPRI